MKTAVEVQVEVLREVIPMVCVECARGTRIVHRSFDNAMFHGTVETGPRCPAEKVHQWLAQIESDLAAVSDPAAPATEPDPAALI